MNFSGRVVVLGAVCLVVLLFMVYVSFTRDEDVLRSHTTGVGRPPTSVASNASRDNPLLDGIDTWSPKTHHSLEGLSNAVTIVTAYFNIGKFQKGASAGHNFTPDMYHKWMGIFAKLHNPLIFYVDNDEDVRFVTSLREHLSTNLTSIVRLTKADMWAFRLRDRIAEIYSQPGYPKHHPNTVVPEYSCAMHAKYECMLMSLRVNPFKTKYFAWLDIGLFRDISQKAAQVDFSIGLPPHLDESKVAYSLVYPSVNASRGSLAPRKVFYDNMVRVCGCYFVARADVMLTWVHGYMRATEHYLAQGLMNTDQQIILAMHVDTNFTHAASLQEYKSDGKHNTWFHLGYLSKEYGETFP